MATKANPRRAQIIGTVIGGILAGRGLKMASGSLLNGLNALMPDDGMGAINLGAINKKKAAVAAGLTAVGALGASKVNNPILLGIALGGTAIAADSMANEVANVFGSGTMQTLRGVGANADLYDDAPLRTGISGNDPEAARQFAGPADMFE